MILARKYIYGPGMDNPAAMVHVDGQNETWYYYFADALGSVRLFTNASGAVVESYQPDPLGYIDGLNLYAYVNNNPLNWVDPWGLWSWRNAGRGALIGAGGGAAAGVYSLAAGPIGVKAFVLRVLIGAVSGAIIGGNTDDGPGLVDQRNQQIDDILSDDSGKCP